MSDDMNTTPRKQLIERYGDYWNTQVVADIDNIEVSEVVECARLGMSKIVENDDEGELDTMVVLS